MHFDWFLPFFRKASTYARTGAAQPKPTRLNRLARLLLPKALFPDHQEAQKGLLRRLLKKVGPS